MSYNKKNKLSKSLVNYSEMASTNELHSLSDVLSDKHMSIHNEMYERAKSKWLSYNTGYDGWIWNEIPSSYWKEPSKAVIVSPTYPIKRKRVDLSKYWDKEYSVENTNKWADTLTYDDSIYNYEVIYVDYVNNKAKLKSKLTSNTLTLDLSSLSEDTPISDDYILTYTFSNLLNQY